MYEKELKCGWVEVSGRRPYFESEIIYLIILPQFFFKAINLWTLQDELLSFLIMFKAYSTVPLSMEREFYSANLLKRTFLLNFYFSAFERKKEKLLDENSSQKKIQRKEENLIFYEHFQIDT